MEESQWIEDQIESNHIKFFNYREFTDVERIGEGGYGIVWGANWNSHGMTVALKSIKLNVIRQPGDRPALDEFIKELKNLRKVFYHPNINQFLGITRDPELGYAMVLQYADSGNLREYLQKKQIKLLEADKYRIALEIAKGLLCLHAESIIHKDLHAKNVLVHRGTMLIADFGLSKELLMEPSDSVSIVKGIPAYIDPQCYVQRTYKRTKASDVFSFGVLLWEIWNEKIPFEGLTHFQINYREGNREKRIDPTPEEYFELYTKCWDQEPGNRPKIEEVVETIENIISGVTSSGASSDTTFSQQTQPTSDSPNVPSGILDCDINMYQSSK